MRFALDNPVFYEVLFRPYLCHQDDPDFKKARTAAFDILYGSARQSLVGTENLADRPSGDIFAASNSSPRCWQPVEE